jgi:hypothetical protein
MFLLRSPVLHGAVVDRSPGSPDCGSWTGRRTRDYGGGQDALVLELVPPLVPGQSAARGHCPFGLDTAISAAGEALSP